MKLKIFIIVISLSISVIVADAQNFSIKSKVLSAGIGLGNSFGYSVTSLPPLSISYEMGVLDEIIDKGVLGIGGTIGFSTYKDNFEGGGIKYNYLFIGARGDLHYPIIEDKKLDTYVGVILGYFIVSSSYFGTWGAQKQSPDPSRLGLAAHVGARYYFDKKFAGMVELGFGISYLTVGCAMTL